MVAPRSARWFPFLICAIALFGLLSRPAHAASPGDDMASRTTPIHTVPLGNDLPSASLSGKRGALPAALGPFLPNTCGSVSGEDDPAVCCLEGYVLVDGEPQPNATVTVTTANGLSVSRPARYLPDGYEVPLPSEPLTITVGSIITVTAQYNDLVTVLTHTIEGLGPTRLDLNLTPNTDLTRISLTPSGGEVYSTDSFGQGVAISQDGAFVAFASNGQGLVPADANSYSDIFAYERATGQMTRVSVASNGTPGNGHSTSPAISANGRYIAFVSTATNFSGFTRSGAYNIFRHDRVTHGTAYVSRARDNAEGNGWSGNPSISDDGRYVAFTSLASNLMDGDTANSWDVFVRDVDSWTTKRVSVSSQGAAANNGDFSMTAQISGNGRYVVFDSIATNLVSGDTNGKRDIFLHNLDTNQTTRISLGMNGAQADGDSIVPQISFDGRFILFVSKAKNLVPSDANGYNDIFLYDRERSGNKIVRISVSAAGVEANNASGHPHLSADGRYITFASAASNLVPGDGNGVDDIFIYHRVSAPLSQWVPWRVPVGHSISESNGYSFFSDLSGDGRFLVFSSFASNLVPDDGNGDSDVFIREMRP